MTEHEHPIQTFEDQASEGLMTLRYRAIEREERRLAIARQVLQLWRRYQRLVNRPWHQDALVQRS